MVWNHTNWNPKFIYCLWFLYLNVVQIRSIDFAVEPALKWTCPEPVQGVRSCEPRRWRFEIANEWRRTTCGSFGKQASRYQSNLESKNICGWMESRQKHLPASGSTCKSFSTAAPPSSTLMLMLPRQLASKPRADHVCQHRGAEADASIPCLMIDMC